MASKLRESGAESQVIADVIGELRAVFPHSVDSVIVPSGDDTELDELLCSPGFLHDHPSIS